MRKIIVFNRISIDGFFSGPHGETEEWFIADRKVEKAAHKIMNIDTVLMGRKTYQLFESVWPKIAEDPGAPAKDKTIAEELNKMTKIVFSKKLKKVSWQNSELMKGNLIAEVKKLKRKKGRDMVIFGSGSIVQQLTDKQLIDEYLLVLTPVILGAGRSMFSGVKRLDPELRETREFKSGNVMLHYRVKRKKK
jgi:dihydrofolate reductase